MRYGKVLATIFFFVFFLEEDTGGAGSEAQEVSRTQLRRTTRAGGNAWTFFWGVMKGFQVKPRNIVRGEFKEVFGDRRVSLFFVFQGGPRSHLYCVCVFFFPGNRVLSLSPSS